MNVVELLQAIDNALPDNQVIADIRRILEDGSGGKAEVAIEVEEGTWEEIPVNAPIQVVTKAFFKEYFGIGFGSFRVQVAVGGVQEEEFGVLFAKYCFATTYYNRTGQLITIDFHKEMR
jgi:hypothetical protein